MMLVWLQRLSLGLVLACLGCTHDHLAQLVGELQSQDLEQRRAAVRQLGELKPQDPFVRTALEQVLSDHDPEVRRLACYALGEIGTSNPEIFMPVLKEPGLSVQLAAAYAVMKIDPSSRQAQEVLQQAMQRGEGGVIVAVTAQGPQAAWAMSTLIQLLRDPRPGIRRLAAEGLGEIGPAAKNALPALEKATRDPDDRVRDAARAAVERLAASSGS